MLKPGDMALVRALNPIWVYRGLYERGGFEGMPTQYMPNQSQVVLVLATYMQFKDQVPYVLVLFPESSGLGHRWTYDDMLTRVKAC